MFSLAIVVLLLSIRAFNGMHLKNAFKLSTSQHKIDKFLPLVIGGAILLSNGQFRDASQLASTTSTSKATVIKSYSSTPRHNIPLIFPGIVYAISRRFRRANGSKSALSSSASIVKFNIAVNSDWSNKDNIMNRLTDSAARDEMNQESGSCSLLTEACLALLQQENNWVAMSFESDHNIKNDIQQAESLFHNAAMKEQSKFKVESVPAIRFSQQESQRVNWPSEQRPTMAVVSIVVAIGGDGSAARNHIANLSDLRAWLQSVAVDNTDEIRSNVMAFQILWTPSESGTTLSKADFTRNYPELVGF